ncbi:Crp/Fnr family transcriptional regulator [Hoeflea ulvae]|uniref:Crp/Fnr family transcriptional regulator n=1 Tax=Hoeflea ulvae TaxID=2983764 RepID=A0ABT3YBA6_9HYPH|nr:Crp/Fnr family transcriptional regulator [Hoeflea ulvae]MCY0093161.1 Crp/Fnr family transcriptional regulator [Hoeflea ulvae]
MPQIQQTQVRNRLLAHVSAEDFARIAPHLEFVELPWRHAFSQPNMLAEYSYFLESGIGSIVAPSPEGHSAEIGIFGREGMTPIATALKADTDPFSTFMQVAGSAYRIRSAALVAAIDESNTLKTLMGRYAQAQAVQSAYTALSNAVHQIDERLARWILMCHDRTDGNDISLTHEFLSIMLAVRRPSVTTALHVLEGNLLIRAERGLIIVRDRQALESFARDAYGTPEREYERLIGKMN